MHCFSPGLARCRRRCILTIRRANTMTRPNRFRSVAIMSALVCAATTVVAQAPVEVVRVISKPVDRQVKLPGEFEPYLAVPIYAKVAGFVKDVKGDRGSVVKPEQVL